MTHDKITCATGSDEEYRQGPSSVRTILSQRIRARDCLKLIFPLFRVEYKFRAVWSSIIL